MAKRLHYVKDGVEMEKVYMNADYHTQEWPKISPNDKVFGDYTSEEGEVTVSFLKEGPSGQPEVKIEWESGREVTVLGVDVAKEYLKMSGARKKAKKE